MKKSNYSLCFPEIEEIKLEEKYALISHAIQLGKCVEADKYLSTMKKAGIDVEQIPSKTVFNKKNDVRLAAQKSNFTFIDLFAGVGGFRIAMQGVGGKCVFSSEWDEAAKETYFMNYGEVPFGDITKPEIKELIPDKFDVLCAGYRMF